MSFQPARLDVDPSILDNNLMFLQPQEELGDLLGSSAQALLPQRSGVQVVMVILAYV